MAVFLFSDVARSTLAAGISAGATSVILAPGTGALFPAPAAGQQFALIFNDAATRLVYEVAYCTARSGDVLTIVRGQEGTTPQAWLIGDNAYNGPTSGTMQAMLQTVHMTDSSLNPIFQSMAAIGAIYAGIGTGFSHRVVFSVHGTYSWTVPPGVGQYFAEVYAPGGAGGSSGPAAISPGSGGGGGGYANKLFYGQVPGTVFPVIVGAGGTCVPFGNGSAGGNTSFNGIFAQGGQGGRAQANILSVGFVPTGGDINQRGGTSTSCISYAGFAAGNNYGGGGGPGAGPLGGQGAPGDQTTGDPGYWPGGGGAGAGDSSQTVGGAGADGGVIIWY